MSKTSRSTARTLQVAEISRLARSYTPAASADKPKIESNQIREDNELFYTPNRSDIRSFRVGEIVAEFFSHLIRDGHHVRKHRCVLCRNIL